MKQLTGAVALVTIALGVMLVIPEEVDASQPDCELVQLWEQEKQQGIDPYRRLGRPALSAEEHRVCLSNWELPRE